MLEVIEKLLVLQERDRKIRRMEGELAHIEPERQMLAQKGAATQAALEDAKLKVRQSEADRKALELEIESKKELIVKYANQQFQTRKNDEYRALAVEIENCKTQIFQIEEKVLTLMEQAEAGVKEVARATDSANATKKLVEEQIAQLEERRKKLTQDLSSLKANREELADGVDESTRNRYQRLLKSKGENVVVGVQHGVCGGCHMRLPPQLLVSCQADKELVTCSNCGRLLYYTADMDMAVAE